MQSLRMGVGFVPFLMRKTMSVTSVFTLDVH